MTYDKNQIMNSKLATKILHNVAEEQNYGSQIAKDIDKSQTSVDRVIQGLKNLGFIEEGRRTQAQYYTIDYEGISSFWYEELKKGMENSPELEQFEKNLLEDVEEIAYASHTQFEKNREDIYEFGKLYFQNYFEMQYVDLELGEVLFLNLYTSITAYQKNIDYRKLEYLSTIKKALRFKLNIASYSEIVEKVIEEMEK